MKYTLFVSKILLLFASVNFVIAKQAPVNPNTSPEAIELLNYIYNLSGKKVLSGQHDYPMSSPYFTRYAREITGKRPAIIGRDFGFSEPNTLDGINFRQKTVDEVIELHKGGAIVTLMWHAVPPTHTEPVQFKPGIQGQLSDKDWKDMLTDGTEINDRWKSQVDVIASYLRQLQLAKVPVIWRPYHEMNGSWFWWGDKPGKGGYESLYRMLYDRLVNYHQLNNLIWVFNANQVTEWVKDYKLYYPGNDVVDILATDVYGEFVDEDYKQLVELSDGKPIALGEVGPFPTPDFLETHPRWVWFMSWSEFLLKTDREEVEKLYADPRVMTREEVKY